MRISDWSSDVCSSDLFDEIYQTQRFDRYKAVVQQMLDAGTAYYCYASKEELDAMRAEQMARKEKPRYDGRWRPEAGKTLPPPPTRSEEHTSELQSLMRNSYAVFCLKKKKHLQPSTTHKPV